MPLRERLIAEEGWRNETYADQYGNHTWGVGHLDRASPLGEYHTNAEINAQLNTDIVRTKAQVVHAIPWVLNLSPIRQDVIYDMAFNMGVGKLMGFKQFLAAAQAGDIDTAVTQMLDSKWATVDVPNRAQNLARIFKADAE